jgi:hypothetical protein
VYREFIGKRDNSQEATLQFVDFAPKPITILFLWLNTNGRFDDLNAHLLCQVWSLPQNLIFEIRSEFVIRHARQRIREDNARKSSFRLAACAPQITRRREDAVTSRGRVKFDEAAFYFTVHGLANEPAFLGCAVVVEADARAAFIGGDD